MVVPSVPEKQPRSLELVEVDLEILVEEDVQKLYLTDLRTLLS
jgi:hypothetical protein